MDRRGGTSFAIFLVLNPILILFYQNCSVVPNKANASINSPSAYRSISNVNEPESCRFASTHSCAE